MKKSIVVTAVLSASLLVGCTSKEERAYYEAQTKALEKQLETIETLENELEELKQQTEEYNHHSYNYEEPKQITEEKTCSDYMVLPDVRGCTIEVAKQQIINAGFVVGNIVNEYSNTYKSGIVTGTKTDDNSNKVTIYKSIGQKTANTDDNNKLSNDEIEQLKQNMNYSHTNLE